MNKRFTQNLLSFCFALLVIPCLAFCQEDKESSDLPSELFGTWKPDIEATKELHKDMDEIELEAIVEEIKNIKITFGEDGELTLSIGAGRTLTAEWLGEPDEENEKLFNVELVREGLPGQPATAEIKDKDTMLFTPGDESAVVMVRDKEDDDSSDASSKLVGSWEGDSDAAAEAAKEEGVDEAVIDSIKQAMADFKLTFKGDGTYVLEMAGSEEGGNWELKETEEDGIYELTAEEVGGDEETRTFTVEFHGDDHVSFRTGDSPAGHVKRVKD